MAESADNLVLMLKSRRPHLKKAEQKIVGFILSNPSKAVELGIRELAEKAGASTASVSRLCAKFGYRSFRQFQLALAQSISGKPSKADDELFSHDAPADVIRKVFALNRVSLEETERILDKQALIKTARWISKAGKVILFGLGGSGMIAKDAEIHMSHLGVEVHAYNDPYQMVVSAAGLGKKDVAVGISHSGQTRSVIESIALCRKSGAKTVAVTNYVESPLAKSADIVLLTSYREREVRSAKSSSRIAQLCILDSLYFIVARLKAGTAKPLVDLIEKRVKETIRQEKW